MFEQRDETSLSLMRGEFAKVVANEARNLSRVFVAAICLFLAWESRADSEPVILRDTAAPRQTGEGILLFVTADGRLFSDGGSTSEGALEGTFKKWRTDGTEPAIRLILFPALKSNSDLKKIRRIIDFLRANRVAYDIMIEPSDAVPDRTFGEQ